MAETPEQSVSGHLHPVTIMTRMVLQHLIRAGFDIADGPEIEDEYYNFDALNVPSDHPARDMQDTFWMKGEPGKLPRTHTSPVQVRYMEKYGPPLRVATFGKAFRYEATDATHETQFHQIEGLALGNDISLAHLKHTLEDLLKSIFGEQAEIQLRPGYFPFVEPGVEIDMRCFRCEGSGCPSCKQSGWIEVLGAGMVHHKVLEHVSIDPKAWQGFAFGIGIDRLVMLKYGIEDIRALYSGDLRLVNQFPA